MKTGKSLFSITQFADEYLRHGEIQDWSAAKNGLQLENNGEVTKIVSAVDCNLLTIQEALRLRADLLIVHHGLFWSDITPLTGSNLRKIRLALEGNLAIYSSHLPLDMHPVIGNNALLAKGLGLRKLRPFFEEKGARIGLRADGTIDRKELLVRTRKLLGGNPLLIPAGPEKIRKIGIVTGGAGNDLARAAAEGVDTFLTGEGAHWTYGLAYDLGINVIYGGHYATETFGVRALGQLLAKKFKLPHSFIDRPSGL
ncbi:Nif3-like dinuclear metal center hexameric protein [Kamptonema cortianum]|nr:Nif3-like dinuclear metal center hexameric protein [Oscillatoria laete-virens]MDK3156458.1 Nif3-like dinuclear metal center hexameric protein [Kamptonema cortianum]MDL5053858.1 Nif3-like dinuclear metal center hexameric protein [Oscillatoria laete-virens NRMC-F 0139]